MYFVNLLEMRYLKYFISIILFFIFATSSVWANPTVQLLTKRHRTEWNWVEYRISLTNTSSEPIVNPEIHYYAADSAVTATVDPISNRYSITSTSTPVGNMSDIKLSVAGTLNSKSKIEIHFRIYKTGWVAYDFSKDWSHQKNMNDVEPNYFMAVYDASHKILWGDDPLNGNHNTGDVVTWNDRGLNTAVTRYNGGNEYIPAGRFWLFKDTPLSPKERDLLAQRGISKLSIGKTRGKIVGAFKTRAKIKKKALDSLITGFYNAIPVADNIPINVELTEEDLYTEKDVCNAKGNCHKEVELHSEFDMEISCWNDVNINSCISTINNCGGKDIGVTRGYIIASVAKDSLQCLSRNRDVESLNVQREIKPLMSTGRKGINISEIQDSEEWKKALAKERADLDWLKDAKYTGEGIVVGVYEQNPIDFDHPDFHEYDSLGNKHPRLMQKDEFYGIGNFDEKNKDQKESIKLKSEDRDFDQVGDNHGTVVSGIIGGNGNNSYNFNYRGVAPKVHFYAATGIRGRNNNQIGHVVNHSHMNEIKAIYSTTDLAYDILY